MSTFYHQPQVNAWRLALKLAALVAAGLLSACVPTTPQWDANFGNSVRTAVAQQILNPDAAQNQDPVIGMDGRAAREAVVSYQKSFKEPPPQPNIFTLGVGGGQ